MRKGRKPGSFGNIVRAFAHAGKNISSDDAYKLRDALKEGDSATIYEIVKAYGLDEIPRGIRDSMPMKYYSWQIHSSYSSPMEGASAQMPSLS